VSKLSLAEATPSLAEARAILIADEALRLSFEARLERGHVFGSEEGEAWTCLREAAEAVVAEHREAMRDAASVAPACPICEGVVGDNGVSGCASCAASARSSTRSRRTNEESP
jgi:hypothetical protein